MGGSNTMRAAITIFVFALQAIQAGANGVSPPDSSARQPPNTDLDFLVNDDARPTAAAPERRPATAWKYWAAAGAAAACGGIGWYLYEANSKPATMRNDQLFTDAH